MQPIFPRRVAILTLLVLGCVMGANHVAARVTFDHGTSLLVAALCRSVITSVVLAALVLWQREPLALQVGGWCWLLLLGLMTALQSVFMYTSVARIPVALSLLVANIFPLLLAFWTWLFGGPRPTRRAALLMGLILVGLALALDLPSRLGGRAAAGISAEDWTLGVSLAFSSAMSFSLGVWIVENKLRAMRGSVRGMFTMLGALCLLCVAGVTGIVPGGLVWPHDAPGWTGLTLLMLLYGTGFCFLFVLMPRLDMARNAPAMNIEPIATLLLGWVVLGQTLAPMQIAGALVVVGGIVLLSIPPRPPATVGAPKETSP